MYKLCDTYFSLSLLPLPYSYINKCIALCLPDSLFCFSLNGSPQSSQHRTYIHNHDALLLKIKYKPPSTFWIKPLSLLWLTTLYHSHIQLNTSITQNIILLLCYTMTHASGFSTCFFAKTHLPDFSYVWLTSACHLDFSKHYSHCENFVISIPPTKSSFTVPHLCCHDK